MQTPTIFFFPNRVPLRLQKGSVGASQGPSKEFLDGWTVFLMAGEAASALSEAPHAGNCGDEGDASVANGISNVAKDLPHFDKT